MKVERIPPSSVLPPPATFVVTLTASEARILERITWLNDTIPTALEAARPGMSRFAIMQFVDNLRIQLQRAGAA